jgi:hypothetical protein
MDNPELSPGTAFRSGPAAFLAKNIVVVLNDKEGEPTAKPKDFLLKHTNGTANNIWFLVEKNFLNKGSDTISAYWLPWNKLKATTLVLGQDADFMFTSELTNCRFSVLTTDMKAPRVAHVPGTGNPTDRDNKEAKEGLPSRKEDSEKRMRRFSSTGLKLSDFEPEEKHFYSGQDGAFKSSAFVYGVRNRDTGIWAFYAQVVEGVMAGKAVDGLKVSTDTLVPLNGSFRIA